MFNDCTQISGKRYIEIAHFVWVLHNILKHTIFAALFRAYFLQRGSFRVSLALVYHHLGPLGGTCPGDPPGQGNLGVDITMLLSQRIVYNLTGERVELSLNRSCHAMLCIAQSCLVLCIAQSCLVLCSAVHRQASLLPPATPLA